MAAERMAPIRVLVVDDHRTFGEALALALEASRGFQVRVATSGEEAVEMFAAARPDVVLMDVHMPRMGGIEAIRRMRVMDPALRVVVLSGFEDDLLKAQALDAGAIGYVSKETPVEELPDMIRRAHGGEALLEREEAVRLLRVLHHRRHQESTERMRANRLTPRQTEILQLLADGLTAPEIAELLDLSPLTLRTHMQNILTRLGVHRKEDAIVLAIRHGKISAQG
jgi:two-component system NarL family response regulator